MEGKTQQGGKTSIAEKASFSEKIFKKEVDSTENVRMENYKKRFVNTCDIKNEALCKSIKSKPATHWKYGGVNRFHTSSALAYRVLPDTVETITVLYKIKDVQYTDKEVTYNMAYIEQKPKKTDILYMEILEKTHGIKLSPSDNIYINNICPSGSMISKDGEYRSGLLNWNSFQIMLKKNNDVNQVFQHIVEYFADALKERKYILLTEYYFPTDKFKNKFQYETELLCSTNKIQFFCIVWFNFYYTYSFGFISNHVNEIFKNLMLKYQKEDMLLFKSLWNKFSHGAVEDLRYICGNYIKSYSTKLHIYDKSKLGQKIIPLNLIEAQNFFNIEYSPWKEFFINNKVSDMVINNICGGFNLANSWFIIKNPDKRFYDNPSQADRLEKSGVALKIAELLSQAKLYTYHNINDKENDIDSKLIEIAMHNASGSKDRITSWLSNEFKVLYNKIQNNIDHVKENIIMSNVSLCLTTEFLGKTLYDAIFFTKHSSYYKKLVPTIFSPENHSHFKKYMFQLCYNLYCLNAKLMVIHGDLHLNNMTLNSIFYKKNVNVEVKNPKIMYIIDNMHQYIFDNNFYDLCIIDFSRSIFNIKNYESFVLDHIPYNIVNNKTQFHNKQVKDLLNYLYSSKPEYIEFGTSIEMAMSHHYSEYFKVLTALDLYNLTVKFIEFLKNPSASSVKVSDKASIKLISELNKSSEYYLTTVLNKLITERNFEEVNDMEWPILSIIKDIFFDNHADNFAHEYDSIVDLYNFNHKMEHSLSSMKHFPPELADKKIYLPKQLLSKDSTESKDCSVKRRQEYENKSLHNYQVINIIQKRQLEKNV
jgi:hypothetical protein